jgi:hypothetical protein
MTAAVANIKPRTNEEGDVVWFSNISVTISQHILTDEKHYDKEEVEQAARAVFLEASAIGSSMTRLELDAKRYETFRILRR